VSGPLRLFHFELKFRSWNSFMGSRKRFRTRLDSAARGFSKLQEALPSPGGERFASWTRRRGALFPKGGISHPSLGETD